MKKTFAFVIIIATMLIAMSTTAFASNANNLHWVYITCGLNGSVTATVDGEIIPSPSRARVEAGKDVVITATPPPGYKVRAWEVDRAVVPGETSNTYTVRNISNTTYVNVGFERDASAVRFSAGSGGSVAATVDGVAIRTGALVDNGKSIVFTAAPNSNREVEEWALNGAAIENSSGALSYTLPNIQAAAEVTVKFRSVAVTAPEGNAFAASATTQGEDLPYAYAGIVLSAWGIDETPRFNRDGDQITIDAGNISEQALLDSITFLQNVEGFRHGDRSSNCSAFARDVIYTAQRTAFYDAHPEHASRAGKTFETVLRIHTKNHKDVDALKVGDHVGLTNRTGGGHSVVVLEVDWANDRFITVEGNVNGRVQWFGERSLSALRRDPLLIIVTTIAYEVRDPDYVAPAPPAQPTQPSNPVQPTQPATPSNPGLVNNTGEIMVLVDGVQVIFDQQPVIQNGRTLVGFRAIAEAMDTEVTWDQATKGIEAIRNGVTVNMTIGSDIMLVNGRQVTLDVPAQILNGRTMLPLRALIEAFDCKVEWDGAQKIVTITTNDTNAPAVSTPATQAPSNPTPTAPAQTAPATNEYVITNNSTGKTLDITITNGSSHSYVKGTAGGSRTGSLNELTYTTMSTNIVVKLNGKTTTVRPGNTVTIQP